MSRILRTKYDNSRCKACNTSIPFGTQVRHTGGYGVTCLPCPHAPDLSQPSTTQPTIASELLSRTERERDEARAEIARLTEALNLARQTYREQHAEIAALRAETEYLAQRTMSREEAIADVKHRRVELLDEVANEAPEPCDDCPI